jgi:hypothetical protein
MRTMWLLRRKTSSPEVAAEVLPPAVASVRRIEITVDRRWIARGVGDVAAGWGEASCGETRGTEPGALEPVTSIEPRAAMEPEGMENKLKLARPPDG